MNTFFQLPLFRFVLLVLLATSLGGSWAWAAPPAGEQENLYAADPQPLSLDQCGQCHTKHYGDLKRDGGRHRFDCRDCHEIIHAYNPVRGNYAELMPKCGQCHASPHGEKHAQCLTCHVNPHAPAVAPALAQVKNLCADCHAEPQRELASKPSRHSKQNCQDCHHDRHGYIPQCSECHRPHFPEQPMNGCTACHPVHRPLDIAFSLEAKPQVCRDCHDEVVTKWSGTSSRHGQVACAACHTRHGLIPKCTECHAVPHDPRQLEMFPRCLDCHLDVHDLPVKKK